MPTVPTLIFINGPAGIGKSTIAQRYIDEHPLALLLSADDLIASMGQWLTNEKEGRKLLFKLVKVMAAEHLRSGHDVVIPYLLTNPAEAAELESIANQHKARFFECVLTAPKEEAITRMIERGSWGEPGSPPLTEQGVPIIEDLFIKMQTSLKQRPNTVQIRSLKGEVERTYAAFTHALQHDLN